MIRITKQNGNELIIPKNDIIAVNLNKLFKAHLNEIEEVELKINTKTSAIAYEVSYSSLERAEEERSKILNLISKIQS